MILSTTSIATNTNVIETANIKENKHNDKDKECMYFLHIPEWYSISNQAKFLIIKWWGFQNVNKFLSIYLHNRSEIHSGYCSLPSLSCKKCKFPECLALFQELKWKIMGLILLFRWGWWLGFLWWLLLLLLWLSWNSCVS